MSRSIFVLALLAAPAVHADPEPHAQGTWLELALDSQQALSGQDQLAIDVPLQHLVIGAQLDRVGIGLETGFIHIPDAAWHIDVGPAVTYSFLSAGATELTGDGALLVRFGLDNHPMTDGGPTFVTVIAGVGVRHWIDPHFAIGGGIQLHLTSESMNMTTDSNIGLGGAFRVSGVF